MFHVILPDERTTTLTGHCLRLCKSTMASRYSQRMARLSARIFVDIARPTDKKSMKVVRIFSGQPAHLNPYLVKYYPRHRELKTLMNGLRDHGLFRDEHEDFKTEMAQRRKAKGKEKKIPGHVLRRLEQEGKLDQ